MKNFSSRMFYVIPNDVIDVNQNFHKTFTSRSTVVKTRKLKLTIYYIFKYVKCYLEDLRIYNMKHNEKFNDIFIVVITS
ncbi:hypothetical protein DSCOOX_07620 [Desulfosarcina ovata subsp. ovata]|uniref:Uncharacterized protein n=1 Tax=Desulfosarcina ovata subsp. ovata TaxID=2752305 RepID=A0A5K8A4W1_9BACT|nr:hypothetical protein DSCOOX_07620 [Desulfosarcina ovata subsp. ovata]